MTEPGTIQIYADGHAGLALLHPDSGQPVLYLNEPFTEGGLEADLAALWARGAFGLKDQINERDGRVTHRMDRRTPPGDPIATWTPDGGLDLVGITPAVQYYIGNASTTVKARMPADLVSLSVIARRVGLAPSSVSNWVNRPEFPAPRTTSPRNWHWPDVVEWLIAHPNLRGVQEWITRTYGEPTDDD